MSIEALLEATQEILLARIDGGEKSIGVQPEGRPPAMMGQWYIAIDEINVQNTERASLKETYSIGVYITLKISVLPADRRSQMYLDRGRSLGKLERRVLAALHGKEDVRLAANRILQIAPGDDPSSGFTLPLYYGGRGRTNLETGEWAGCEPDKASFAVRVLTFSGGTRLQNLAEIQ